MRKAASLAITLIAALFLGLPLLAALKQWHVAEEQAVVSTPTRATPPDHDRVLHPAPPRRPPVMTQAQFHQTRSGMTYEECLRVVGVEGEATHPPRRGAEGVTAAYKWLDPQGANEFVLGFREGRLTGRSMNMSPSARTTTQARQSAIQAQTSVIGDAEVRRFEQAARQARQPIVITLDEFGQIRRGMTYDDCVAIIGAENPKARLYADQRRAVLSGRGGLDTLTEGYQWRNLGGYYAEIAFHNARVTTKTWKKGPIGGGGRASGRGGR